eukprot:scaffold32284_cov29-Phaeocystis_antarctica.AAC.1
MRGAKGHASKTARYSPLNPYGLLETVRYRSGFFSGFLTVVYRLTRWYGLTRWSKCCLCHQPHHSSCSTTIPLPKSTYLPWYVARVRNQPTPDRGQALPPRLGAVAWAPSASEAHGAVKYGE